MNRSAEIWQSRISLAAWIGMLSPFAMLSIVTIAEFILQYRNLMAKDEFKNLGFSDEKAADAAKKVEKEKSHEGELRWW